MGGSRAPLGYLRLVVRAWRPTAERESAMADFQMTEPARHSTSAIVMDVASMTVRAEMARGKTEYWLWQAVANG